MTETAPPFFCERYRCAWKANMLVRVLFWSRSFSRSKKPHSPNLQATDSYLPLWLRFPVWGRIGAVDEIQPRELFGSSSMSFVWQLVVSSHYYIKMLCVARLLEPVSFFLLSTTSFLFLFFGYLFVTDQSRNSFVSNGSAVKWTMNEVWTTARICNLWERTRAIGREEGGLQTVSYRNTIHTDFVSCLKSLQIQTENNSTCQTLRG